MIKSAILVALALVFCSLSHADDQLEKIMKEGFKGKTSPMAKVINGTATPDETDKLVKLVHSMRDTKAPIGDQSDFERRVATLIGALDSVVGGDKSREAVGNLKGASNCKSCHSRHRPD